MIPFARYTGRAVSIFLPSDPSRLSRFSAASRHCGVRLSFRNHQTSSKIGQVNYSSLQLPPAHETPTLATIADLVFVTQSHVGTRPDSRCCLDDINADQGFLVLGKFSGLAIGLDNLLFSCLASIISIVSRASPLLY